MKTLNVGLPPDSRGFFFLKTQKACNKNSDFQPALFTLQLEDYFSFFLHVISKKLYYIYAFCICISLMTAMAVSVPVCCFNFPLPNSVSLLHCTAFK